MTSTVMAREGQDGSTSLHGGGGGRQLSTNSTHKVGARQRSKNSNPNERPNRAGRAHQHGNDGPTCASDLQYRRSQHWVTKHNGETKYPHIFVPLVQTSTVKTATEEVFVRDCPRLSCIFLACIRTSLQNNHGILRPDHQRSACLGHEGIR